MYGESDAEILMTRNLLVIDQVRNAGLLAYQDYVSRRRKWEVQLSTSVHAIVNLAKHSISSGW